MGAGAGDRDRVGSVSTTATPWDHGTGVSPGLESFKKPCARRGKDRLRRVMDEITPTTRPVPAGWLEALADSRAELAAGLTGPGDEVMRALYESIARLEARRTDGPTREVKRRR